MDKLIYEFQSVTDKNGKDILTKELHANPVHLMSVVIGKKAILQYVDKQNDGIVTSKVEEMQIHLDHIRITTENTTYWLEPHIRKEVYYGE